MYCPNCGAINNENNETCFICEYDLKKAKQYNKREMNDFSNDLNIKKGNIEETAENIKKRKKIKEKKNNKNKFIGIFLIVIFFLISFMCIISGSVLSNNEDEIKDYLKDNNIDTSLFDGFEDTTPPSFIIDDEGNIIYADDFKYTDLKYENLDLVKTEYKEFEIELPKEMEYVEFSEEEREEENLTEYFHVWRGGYDFDIIKMDILEECDDIYEAAQMFYKDAENTFIPGTDNECAYNNIKIEETTVSGYDAYKVSAFMKTEGEHVVVWVFKAPDIDDYVHVIAADVVYEDVVLLNFIDTYKYKGI